MEKLWKNGDFPLLNKPVEPYKLPWYKNPGGNCLVLAENHLSGILSMSLKSVKCKTFNFHKDHGNWLKI